MKKDNPPVFFKEKNVRMKQFSIILLFVWWVIVVASFSWNYFQKIQGMHESALIEARIAFQKDILYRKWNAMYGGVYVKVSNDIQPNPYLTVPDRDLTTKSGQVLTLINPAYMTRQIHELQELEKGIKSHITSLKPIRPANKADKWELNALKQFEKGATEISELQTIENKEFMRLMRPLVVEKPCLKCHAIQGYKVGDIRGGISVSIPMKSLRVILNKQKVTLVLGHGVILILGCFGIWIAGRREEERKKERYVSNIKLENTIRHSEKIIEAALDAIVQVEASGNIISWNPQAELIFGWRASEVLGRQMSEIIIPEKYREMHKNGMKHYLEKRHPKILNKRIEISAMHKSGNKFPVELTVTPIEENDSIIFCAFLRDITEKKNIEIELQTHQGHLEQLVKNRTQELDQSLKELKKTQEHLIQTEKMASLGDLVAGVAHEINTPLGIGTTEASFLDEVTKDCFKLFEKEKLTQSAFEKYFQNALSSSASILRNLKRAAEIINSFKQVAVDQTEEARRNFKIKQYIAEVLLSLHAATKRTQHSIQINCAEDLGIYSYPGAFAQIITNFVMNSMLHGFDGIEDGKIVFDISIVKPHLVFTYYDNGKGMDEETVASVFEPFFTTKRNAGGTGLGLHIVYNLVTQKLKGEIKCNSSLGRKTEFIIKIPYEN